MCMEPCPLGGGVCLPRKLFNFTYSEVASGGSKRLEISY